MSEVLLLARRLWGELSFRVLTTFASTFAGLYMLGVMLADNVPEWIKQFSWLLSFSHALRALPPWDFALIALSFAIVTSYMQRLLKFFLRRRNTMNLKKLTLEELRDGSEEMSPQQRRLRMAARGRLLARIVLLSTATGSVLGVIVALFLFGYVPSAIIILVVLLFVLFYLRIAIPKWLRVYEANEQSHQRLREMLNEKDTDPTEIEIQVHTERLLLKAKLPVSRFLIIWPMLAFVFPALVGAAAIESWMYQSAGVDSTMNKLLLVLMALSLRSMFKLITITEVVASLAARAIKPDPFGGEDEDDA